MNFPSFPRAASIGALGLSLAMGHAAVFAQARPNQNSAAGPNINGIAASTANALDDGLPKKRPKPIRNQDGTPAGDAALGIAPDPEVALPTADQIKKPAHRKHKVSRGVVQREKFPSRPQPVITTLR